MGTAEHPGGHQHELGPSKALGCKSLKTLGSVLELIHMVAPYSDKWRKSSASPLEATESCHANRLQEVVSASHKCFDLLSPALHVEPRVAMNWWFFNRKVIGILKYRRLLD